VSIEVTLVTGRTIEQGIAMESMGKLSIDYLNTISIIYLNSQDAEKLNLRDGDEVEISRNDRSVIAIVKIDSTLREGVAFMPYGPVVNYLTNSETSGSSTPTYKGFKVRIRKSLGKAKLNVIKHVELPGVGERRLSDGEYRVVKDVTCPFCALLCDNLVVKIQGERIIDVENACAIARAKFLNYHRDRVLKPMIYENGRYRIVTLEEALDVAAEILANAKYPLLYGWSCTTCEAIDLGLELTEILGGVYDNTASVCHGPTLMAIAETGTPDFTLGFTRHYADIVIIWGWNPRNAHVNFLQRFIKPEGKIIKDRSERRVVVIDVRESQVYVRPKIDYSKCLTCEVCRVYCPDALVQTDKVITTPRGKKFIIRTIEINYDKCRECNLCTLQCPLGAITVEKSVNDVWKVIPGRDYELLTALRMVLRDLEIEKRSIAGIDREKVIELGEAIKRSKYCVVLFGVGLTHSGAKYQNVVEAIRLVHDINEVTKGTILAMRGHFNVTGANVVALWTYGAPFGIDLSRGFPRYIPGVTTAVDLLSRGEVDAMLVIGADPLASFPRDAVEHMMKIPVIVIDPKPSLTSTIAKVIIPSALSGIECEGTVYRLDYIPLRLRKIVDPPENVYPDTYILKELIRRVKKIKGIE